MQKDGTRASSLEFGFDFVIVSLSHLWPWATTRLWMSTTTRQANEARISLSCQFHHANAPASRRQ